MLKCFQNISEICLEIILTCLKVGLWLGPLGLLTQALSSPSLSSTLAWGGLARPSPRLWPAWRWTETTQRAEAAPAGSRVTGSHSLRTSTSPRRVLRSSLHWICR